MRKKLAVLLRSTQVGLERLSGTATNVARIAKRRELRLQSSTMSTILQLSGVLSADVEDQISWFQTKGLLASTKNCPACSQAMTLQQRSDITDKYRYGSQFSHHEI